MARIRVMVRGEG